MLRCLFNLRNPYSGIPMRLAIVRELQAQPGAGRMQYSSTLVKVSESSLKYSTNEGVVEINSIVGMAQLISHIDKLR